MSKLIVYVSLATLFFLTGCNNNSEEVIQSLIKERDTAQEKQNMVEKQLNEAIAQSKALQQKIYDSTEMAGKQLTDRDKLAMYVKQNVHTITTNTEIGPGISLLQAYIVAEHLLPPIYYSQKETVKPTDPMITLYSGNVLEKQIKDRFMALTFEKPVTLPIYTIEQGQISVLCQELVLVVYADTKVPSIFVKNDDGDYSHYVSQPLDGKIYDPKIWFDEILHIDQATRGMTGE